VSESSFSHPPGLHFTDGEHEETDMRSGSIGGRSRLGVTALGLALLAGAATAGQAIAAPDPLASGSVALQLKSSGGLKLKPATRTLPITTGELDPTTGAGTVETRGAIRARSRGRKAKVKITALVFGANGGAGKINARIGKRKVNGFGKLSGGTLTRVGWGARVDGVTARLGSKGAKALRRALTPGSGAKASAAAGGIKAGKRLGTVSVSGTPRTVAVLPGGTLVLHADSAFGLKLIAHCVGALDGGVSAIAPAVQSGVLGEFFTFPVTGGSIAPDFSAGRVISGGGQVLTKNNGLLTPLSCPSEPPPAGTDITNTEFEAQFDLKAFASFTTTPDGPVGLGALGTFDLAAATSSADVNTKQITVMDAPVTLDPLAAIILNTVFPNRSGNANNDFTAGEPLGTISLSVTTQ
jgi:hypothetical protein